MAKKKGSLKSLNKYQKAAFRKGDHRSRRDDVARYLELAQSTSPLERLEAAENLCPCHVRTHIDEVWQALYRMMEDPDTKVRRAAWHTLEDGGVPDDDPTLDAIFDRAIANLSDEPDKATRNFITEFALPRVQEREQVELQRQALSGNKYNLQGKCDFCSEANTQVRTDFETELMLSGGDMRFGSICAKCDT